MLERETVTCFRRGGQEFAIVWTKRDGHVVRSTYYVDGRAVAHDSYMNKARLARMRERRTPEGWQRLET